MRCWSWKRSGENWVKSSTLTGEWANKKELDLQADRIGYAFIIWALKDSLQYFRVEDRLHKDTKIFRNPVEGLSSGLR